MWKGLEIYIPMMIDLVYKSSGLNLTDELSILRDICFKSINLCVFVEHVLDYGCWSRGMLCSYLSFGYHLDNCCFVLNILKPFQMLTAPTIVKYRFYSAFWNTILISNSFQLFMGWKIRYMLTSFSLINSGVKTCPSFKLYSYGFKWYLNVSWYEWKMYTLPKMRWVELWNSAR